MQLSGSRREILPAAAAYDFAFGPQGRTATGRPSLSSDLCRPT
jgi:hypothetical protein